MWEYLIKNLLKRETKETPELHQVSSISHVESYKKSKISPLNEIHSFNPTSMRPQKRVLNCPVCKTPMRTRIFPNTQIEVDECPNCKGIFLDKGELQEIMGYDLEIYQQNQTLLIYTPHGKKK
ncbi:MAG: zf-TFIIB domain-containing protein [Leptospiraceae bacterium]|nr:zf-TFIIB domain-containing protein [Leptospiraceae bacterium]MDW7974935.1 zf-TFIIB domain-containing protein [Leptospiraceae bacterium]